MGTVSFWEEESQRETGGSGSCTTTCMNLMPPNWTLNSGLHGKCYVYFTTIKNTCTKKSKQETGSCWEMGS